MVTKTSENGRPYDINGRTFVWHPEDDDGVRGNLPDVQIPLRIKLKLVLAMGEDDLTASNSKMIGLVNALIKGESSEVVQEMDVNDFQDMFTTWMSEYNTLTGASLGESSGSVASSASTEPLSSTTSEVVSASV